MNLPGPRIGLPWSASGTTRRWKTTTSTFDSSPTASGRTLQASTTGTSTSRATRRTTLRRRSTSRSRRSELNLGKRKGRRNHDGLSLWNEPVKYLLRERRDSRSLVVLDIEDGVELRDLQ